MNFWLSHPHPSVVWMYYLNFAFSVTMEVWTGAFSLVQAEDAGDDTPNYASHWNRNVVIGLILYVIGTFEQHRAHVMLAGLRKGPNSSQYSIPRGAMFEFVWSPQYMAEALIYLGLLFASQFKLLSMTLITWFVITTMIKQATETKKWYLARPDVQNNAQLVARKALIPYVI